MGTLVRTFSEDGWELEGMVWEPTAQAKPWVVVMIHGVAGRFYSRTLASTAVILAQAGIATVSCNVRGHDYGALLTHRDGSLRLFGGAWEDLREAPLDLGGWVEWAKARWPDRSIALLGHSLGGWKVADFQSRRHPIQVRQLLLASPVYHPSRWWDEEAARRAQDLVDRGQGDQLVEGLASRIGAVSARTLLSRAPQNWPHVLPDLLEQAGIPALVTYGTEQDILDAAAIEEFNARIPVHVIRGADHHYRYHSDALAAAIEGTLAPV